MLFMPRNSMCKGPEARGVGVGTQRQRAVLPLPGGAKWREEEMGMRNALHRYLQAS